MRSSFSAAPVEASASGFTAPRLEGLTVARFYAALAVFLFHASLIGFYAPEGAESDTARSAMRNLGNFGVTFFFVLSGFVLTWSKRQSDTYVAFIARRAARLFPTHWVTSLIAMAVTGAGSATAVTYVSNAGLLHSWSTSASTFFSVNFPSWSISTELFFYAVFPLLVVPIARLRQRGAALLLAGAVCVVVALPAVTALEPFSSAATFDSSFAASPVHGHSELTVWFLYVFPVTRCLDFVTGICLAVLLRGPAARTISVPRAALFLAVTYGLSMLVPLEWQLDALPLIGAVPVVAAVARRDVLRRDVAPSRVRRIGIELGRASFSFYLLHEIVLKGMRRIPWAVTESAPTQLGVTAIAFVVALTGAVVINRFVEEPPIHALARRQRNQVGRPPPPSREPSAPGAVPAPPAPRA
jgi:peptidoglycan/LPS O-acetylase OafA/YrhL